ncbi:MAG: hypothetical protein QNJ92_08875 [Alphaproteobacteria bacterium]|nr:hypothetical protein [Alphaproteobacteria bacterium]
MGCANIHDFITGTTIALPRRHLSGRAMGEALDIVRPNLDAEALVARHIQALEGLHAAAVSEIPLQ